MRERVVEKEVTEYIEKKVRRKTIETPVPIGDWRQNAQYQQSLRSTTQMHAFERSQSPEIEVSPVRTVMTAKSSAVARQSIAVNSGHARRETVTYHQQAYAEPRRTVVQQHHTVVESAPQVQVSAVKTYSSPARKVTTTTGQMSMSATKTTTMSASRKSISPVRKSKASSSPKKQMKTSANASYVDLTSTSKTEIDLSTLTEGQRELFRVYKQDELALYQQEIDAAREAIWNLDKATIAEIKSYTKPTEPVKRTAEAVMILLGQEPDWKNAKKVMTGAKFKEMLRDLNPDALSN